MKLISVFSLTVLFGINTGSIFAMETHTHLTPNIFFSFWGMMFFFLIRLGGRKCTSVSIFFLVIICSLPLRCCEMYVTVLPGQVLWPVNLVHNTLYEC